MLEKEISHKEFNELTLLSAKDTLNILKQKYNKEYQEAINDFQALSNDFAEMGNYTPTKHTETELITLFSEEEFIDYIEDIIDKPLTKEYYVTDSVGTDKGTHHMIVERGYEILI